LDKHSVIVAFRIMTKDKAADVFSNLSPDVQQTIIESASDSEISHIINELFLDDAVDFVDEMPAYVVKRILANATPDRRKLINSFLQYPENSVGSIMTIEYVNLRRSFTVAEAFSYIRNTGTDKETIYTCYVTDNERRLLGLVTARSLFLADSDQLIEDIMDPNVFSFKTHDEKGELVNSFSKYGFIAVPVVDNENRLVGIVTYDDALRIQEEEDTEDFEKMAALSPSERPYMETGIISLSKNRIPWLFLLNLSVFLTGAIIKKYEDIYAALPILITFLPMLMDTSGDAGSQSSTLIIRGMAIGEIKMSDALAVLWKEFRVAIVCGVSLASINFARVIIFKHGIRLAVVSSLALFSAIIMSKLLGAVLPIAAEKINLDPAVMAGPVLTTIVDAITLIVYFSLAMLILGM